MGELKREIKIIKWNKQRIPNILCGNTACFFQQSTFCKSPLHLFEMKCDRNSLYKKLTKYENKPEGVSFPYLFQIQAQLSPNSVLQ